jgi:predicted hotdog family 3-hydroxylacyl-ACP dehydratase
MITDRATVKSLIPQQGAMCLLDSIEYWNGQRIICTSMQHRSAGNPLRTRKALSSLHGIEFAAQAVAAHGGLTATGQARPRVGLLLSARDCKFHRWKLDDIEGPLVIEAELMGANDRTRQYRFKVSAQETVAVEGRVAVILYEGSVP